MNDDLSKLLKGWEVESPTPPGFRGRVWSRIEAGESAAFLPRLREWFAGLLATPRPGLAVFAAAAAIVMGSLIGSGLAETDGAQSYLRSVNPYAHVQHNR